MIPQKEIPQSKLRKALRQAFCSDTSQECFERIDRALETLPQILAHCGETSWARQSLFRIAHALAQSRPFLLAPCCPDYAYASGLYTFSGIGSGVSLLAQQQIRFLECITPFIPNARVLFLLADQEAEDIAIVRRTGVTPEVFRRRIDESLVATQEAVCRYGWSAAKMTEAVTGFTEISAVAEQRILNEKKWEQRIIAETMQRRSMYERIQSSMSAEEACRRTIHTAAQYMAIGLFAAERRALICNHTTTNLAWYGETGTALLHNPISIY